MGRLWMNISEQIAHRVREERKRRGWSLDVLAGRAHVSRAMISKIERKALNQLRR